MRSPLVAFFACGLIWGTTFLVIRVGNDSLPALWACTLRLGLATLILHGIMLATRQSWPRGEALKAALYYGFWEFGVSLTLLYWGERVVPSGLAAVLYAICPIAAMFEARVLGIEKLDPSRLAAAALAIVGVGVIFWRELGQGSTAMGIACIFVAACAAPLAGLLLQRGPHQSAIGVNAVGSLVGLPIALIASVILGENRAIPSTAQQVLPIIYLAVAGSVFAFVIFAWLMRHWKATNASFLGVVVPVIAVIAGAIARHEAFSPASMAGAGIVIVAVAIALGADLRKTADEPRSIRRSRASSTRNT
jgi:drug/metabolite transporter (DMT)-like permease